MAVRPGDRVWSVGLVVLVSLHLLVFLTTWRALDHTRLRQVLGLVLAAFYLWLTTSNA